MFGVAELMVWSDGKSLAQRNKRLALQIKVAMRKDHGRLVSHSITTSCGLRSMPTSGISVWSQGCGIILYHIPYINVNHRLEKRPLERIDRETPDPAKQVWVWTIQDFRIPLFKRDSGRFARLSLEKRSDRRFWRSFLCVAFCNLVALTIRFEEVHEFGFNVVPSWGGNK
ncbi:hypothetical protein B0J17DRAFT_631973 [Rhizoctonia solani]|nr:hypothetical protein B0J17DRAFT_631973 [Rhizoctonia solani]